MKLYFLCLSALTVGALCKIDDVCIVQSGKKGVEGKCQKKGECMKAGLAAFSKSGRTDISGTIEELACPGEDEEVQCCVEIKCGSHTCRNKVESNPCAEGVYVANFRDRNLCPSTSLEDNVQCCVENSHNGLKRRWTFNRNDPDYIGTGIGNSVSGSTYSNGNGFDLSSAAGVMSTLNNNDAPSVGTGIAPIVPISPLGGFEPTTPGANVALSGDASTSTGTLGALPITANTIGTTSDTSGGVAPGISDTSIALGGTTPAGTNTAIALGGTTPAGTDLALSGTTPAGIDIASGGTTPASSSNFNLAQIDNYSQSPGGMSPGGSTPDEGVSFGLNHGLRPEVTYTNGGGSTFSVGPTTSVPGMLMNPGSSINGVQGGFSMDFRKLKRSLANAFI